MPTSTADYGTDNAGGIVLMPHPDAVKVAAKDILEASSQYMKYISATLLTSDTPLYRSLPSTATTRAREDGEVKRIGRGGAVRKTEGRKVCMWSRV